MTHHEERENATLARQIAADFLAKHDGKGFTDALAVMLEIATNPKVRARVRANTARAYVGLAIRAAEIGKVGKAIQINNNPGPLPAVRDRGFWQAALADPTLRAELLADLASQLGAEMPKRATRPAKPATNGTAEKAAPAANGKATRSAKRAPPRNGTAHANGNGRS